jgi:hypothetical protein
MKEVQQVRSVGRKRLWGFEGNRGKTALARPNMAMSAEVRIDDGCPFYGFQPDD